MTPPDGSFATFAFLQHHRIAISRVFALVFFAIVLATTSAQEGSLVEPILFMSGLALVGIATVGRLWCSLYISGLKNSELITVGPYSVTRNPLYFFSFLGFAGVGLATETLTLAIVFCVFFAVLYPVIILGEERFLRERFGAAFDAYCQRTPRFFPRLSLYAEPASWSVDTLRFRHTMVDVVWFVWLVALIEMVEALHEHGVIGALVALP